MVQFSSNRHRVPFDLLFKSVFGFAVLGLVSIGTVLAFVPMSASAKLTFQILATIVGAAIGGYGALRASRDASSD